MGVAPPHVNTTPQPKLLTSGECVSEELDNLLNIHIIHGASTSME